MGADTKKEVAEEGNAEPGGYRRQAGVDEGQRAEDAGRAGGGGGGGGQLGDQSPGGGWALCEGVEPERLRVSPGPTLLRSQYTRPPCQHPLVFQGELL